MLFSLNFKYTTEEEIAIHHLSDFSNLLHIPCTECNDKIWFSRIATALDAISYSYRLNSDMKTILQSFFSKSTGNSVGLMLDNINFSLPGEIYYDKLFNRSDESNEKIPAPLIFPENPCDNTTARLIVSRGLADFYGLYTAKADFRTNIDDLGEARNYLKFLEESFRENPFHFD